MVFHFAPIIAIAKIGEFPSGACLPTRFFMARPLRIEYSRAVYHITSKGNEKIEETVERFGYFYKEDHGSKEGDANKIGLSPSDLQA
jgi:hypothetical protein